MRHLRKMKSLAVTAASLMVAVLLLPAFSSSVLAQSSKGIIVGTITDPSGAVVGGASIKITNKATNTSRETTTGAEGGYRLDAVDPGSYKVEATAEASNQYSRQRGRGSSPGCDDRLCF